MIIEPITAYNNLIATPYYFKRLRAIAKENGIPFIVDECKTGLGITGKMWAHENWNLSDPVDFVTFGERSGLSGFFSSLDFRLNQFPYIDQSVDMAKLLNFGITWQTIQRKNLLSLVNDTSTFLKIELNRVEKEKGWITNVRGYGTFIGFDTPYGDNLQKWLFKSGIHLLRCGPTTFGMRPALILGPKHAAHIRESLINYHPNYKPSF